MKKLYFVALLMAISFTNLFSAPVDTAITSRVAVNFYAGRTRMASDLSQVPQQLVYTAKMMLSGQTDSMDGFRIYNVGSGYVIVSADDRFVPVLAYSLENNFRMADVPESMVSLLNDYLDEMRSALADNVPVSESIQSKWQELSSETVHFTRFGTPVIGPLLTTTWNQSSYYNNLCPVDPEGPNGHVYAGCVATAMAQIIRYWQYPEHGIGSHTYVANFESDGYGDYGTQTANFAAATYNYANMPNSISSSTSLSQQNEVAQLIYHCAVSVDMMFGPSGSGAYSEDVPSSLMNYFGYVGSHHEYRGDYSYVTWMNMLKSSLNDLQPIYYHGSGSGGHAFIFDGYDSEDYFHVNWGWGGYLNDYFQISALTPGTHDYNSGQGAVLGITALTPIIQPDKHSLSFLVEQGTVSEGAPVNVFTNALTEPLTATATGRFQISLDSVNYANTQTLSANGGTLYVRYASSFDANTDHGYLNLSSGNQNDIISLTGIGYTIRCGAPENLTVTTQDMQNVNIQWDPANMGLTQQELSWDVEDPSFGTGYGSDYMVTYLHRFCDTDLVAYHGLSLVSIDFYAYPGVTTYKAVVYKGGGYDGISFNSGTQVLAQNIPLNTLAMNSWNTVTLNAPVEIDASQELWFGIYLEAPGGTYAMPICPVSVPDKSNIYGYHDNNSVFWDRYSDGIRSFCLAGNVEDRHQLDHYEVFRDQVSIGTTGSLSMQDHLNGTGTHLYTVVANWLHGCTASAQCYFTNTPHITAVPGALDFYTSDGFDNRVQKVTLIGNGLTANIQAAVNGNFLISSDSVQFGTNATFPQMGGTLYAKYVPGTDPSPFESGTVTLQSGSVSATVPLTGQSCEPCSPPRDLVLSQTDSRMDATWLAPEVNVTNQYPLTWCSSYNMNYGSFTDMKTYLMHRFEPSDLTPYHHKLLKSISFIPHSSVTVYKLVVFQGGSYDGTNYDPGTLVMEQTVDISTLTNNEWNTVALSTPVVINAREELWYGIYLEAPVGNYPYRVGTPYVAHKGSISKSLTSYPYNWSEYSSTYSFSLNATVEDAPRSCVLYQIDRNEEFVSNTNDTHYSDYLTQDNLYHYTVWSVWNDGCRAAVRESILMTGLCSHDGESTTLEVCDSCIWNGTRYTTSGTYYHAWLNGGCTQVDTLYLTVHYSMPHEEYLPICVNDFPFYYGDTVFEVGTPAYSVHQFHYTTIYGCDSTVTLHLVVSEPQHLSTSAEANHSYTWYDSTYTESGTYTHSHLGMNGCVQVDTLYLTIHPASSTDVYATVCGEYTWNENTYTVSGDYVQTFSDIHGADSTVTLHLIVHQPDNQITTVVAQNPYLWHDSLYSASGYYTYEHEDVNGCEQVDTLHLIICTPNSGDTTAFACDSFDWYEYTGLTQSGDYERIFTNVAGCDSVVTLHLTVAHTTYGTETISACDTFIWYGEIFTTSGDYIRTLLNAMGCDSIVTLHLTIKHKTYGPNLVETVCENYMWNGVIYTESGDYEQVFTNSVGCDSVVALHLTVVTPPEMSYILGEASICRYQDATYEYNTSNSNYHYKWFKNNELWQENVSSVHLNESMAGNVLLTMHVSDFADACEASTSLLVSVQQGVVPARAEIRRKPNSNILICQPVTSEYGEVHYRWGYTHRGSSYEHVLSGDRNYCQFDLGIDTVNYLYWVETFIRSGGDECVTRSYYGEDINTTVPGLERAKVNAYMSDGQIVLSVSALSQENVNAELYSTAGSKLLHKNYGRTDTVSDLIPVNVSQGVYVLKVMVGQEVYLFKLLKI